MKLIDLCLQIHGGIVTTLLQEGIERHLHNFHKQHGKLQAEAISVDFKQQMRPGEIYAVYVPPAAREIDPQPDVLHLLMMPLVWRADAPPRMSPDGREVEFQDTDELHAVGKVQVRLVKDGNETETTEAEADFRTQAVEGQP